MIRRKRKSRKARIAELRLEVTRLQGALTVTNEALTSTKRELAHAKTSEPAARALVERLLKHRPFSDLCAIGPNGCQTHFGSADGGDCTVAWLRAWIAGYIRSDKAITSLAMMMTIHDDAADILKKALREYEANHEPDGAREGHEGARVRHDTRLARDLAVAIDGRV